MVATKLRLVLYRIDQWPTIEHTGGGEGAGVVGFDGQAGTKTNAIFTFFVTFLISI